MKVLLVTSRYPWPPRRGDQVRAAQMLALLAGEHETTLLAPVPPRGSAPPPPSVRLETYRPAGWAGAAAGVARAASRRLPLQSGLFYHPDLKHRLARLAPASDLVVLQLARLAGHLGDLGATPLVVDLIDSLALNLERRAAVDHPWLRPALRLEARLLAAVERGLAGRARSLLVVCERDREQLVSDLAPELAERVRVVPLAVAPAEQASLAQQAPVSATGLSPPPAPASTTREPLIVFTGNLGYFVNADALTWFLREVWAPLRARRPRARLVAAGDRPARAVVRAVAKLGADSGVSPLASPADLRPVLAAAAIAVAPLRAGSGVPVKILEAWAAGLPVVASPWAAAGTTGVAGVDLTVAERPGDWVEALLTLLARPEERRRLGENGRRRLAADYSPDSVRRRLLAALAPLS